MPNSANTGFDAARFAALVARFDIANPSEAEAMNAARAIRRMLTAGSLRFVDVLGRADVTQALDVSMKPVREDSEELKAAFLEIAKYAELARTLSETVIKLRQNPGSYRAIAAETAGLVNGGLVTLVVIGAVALMIAAVWR